MALLSLVTGCGRAPAPPAPTVSASPAAADANARSVTAVSVTALRAGQHVAVIGGSDGRAMLGLPGGGGRGPVVVVGADGVRDVSPDLGKNAADVPAVLPAGVEIKAIAPLPRGGVLLYVADSSNRDAAGGLWRWRPGAAAERVADTRAVAEQSGMGSLLALADAQAVAAGDDVWLALRSPDQAALLRIDAGRFAGGDLRVSPALTNLRGDSPAFRLAVEDQWYARADGGLCLLRPATGESWRLDATGLLVALPPVEGRPVSPVPPLDLPAWRGAAVGSGGRVIRFYPDPPPRGSDQVDADAAVRYPAFVVTDAAGVDTVYDRDAIHVRAGFPTHGLRLGAWCVDPTGGDVLGYDAMSGEVFRLTFGR